MPRIAKTLTTIAVRNLIKKPGRWPVGGVPGLLLQVGENGAVSWLLRVLADGRRRDIGLGSFRAVDLATARNLAREKHAQLREGRDPVAERRRLIAERATHNKRLTFDEAAKLCHAAISEQFRNEKAKAQWLKTVETYVSPKLGKMSVEDVGVQHVVDVLTPIWTTKTETASRLRGRVEAILDWATVSKHRSGPNPARWKGNLSHLLPNAKKLTKRKRQHHPALPWKDVPAFMRALRAQRGVAAKALELAILTAARSSEVRLATWSEIDWKAKLWTVPEQHIKGNRVHRVPLTPAAVQLLESLPRLEDCDLLFPNRKGSALSDMALLKVIRDMHESNVTAGGQGYVDPTVNRVATPHGTARSSFKDWARNMPGHVDEVSELALAHVNSDETRAAYARDELLPQRTLLMREWADFIGGAANDEKKKQKKRKRKAKR